MSSFKFKNGKQDKPPHSNKFDSRSDSDSESNDKELLSRSCFKLRPTAEQLLKLISALRTRLVIDFEMDTLHVRNYPNPTSSYRFRSYLIHNGVVVADGFNYTAETVHSEEAVISGLFKRVQGYRGNLTKNTVKWERLLRTNAEERVQRQCKKVVSEKASKVKVGSVFEFEFKFGDGIGLGPRDRQREVSCCA